MIRDVKVKRSLYLAPSESDLLLQQHVAHLHLRLFNLPHRHRARSSEAASGAPAAPWTMTSPSLTGCRCHPAFRRPFPAGDRVTFNGKDCLCQYCVEPMSPGPKDILGSSSKSLLSNKHMHRKALALSSQGQDDYKRILKSC